MTEFERRVSWRLYCRTTTLIAQRRLVAAGVCASIGRAVWPHELAFTFLVGVVAAERGKTPKAQQLFEFVIEKSMLDCWRTFSLIELGKLYQEEGDLSAANKFLSHALTISKDTLDETWGQAMLYGSLEALAGLACDEGDLKLSRTLRLQALEVEPDSAVSMANLALTEYELGHDAEAIRRMQKALEIEPHRVEWQELLNRFQSGPCAYLGECE